MPALPQPSPQTPVAGYGFVGFTGALTGTVTPRTPVMNAPRTVTGNFVLATSVTVAPAAGQYSDPVTLSATIEPAGALFSGSLQFQIAAVNVGAALPVNGAGTYTTSYTITQAAGPYAITAILTPTTPGVAGSSGSNTLTVSKEDATVTPSATNPQIVNVNSNGGTAGPITLKGTVQETPDGSPGNISLATVTVTLAPVGTMSVNCPVTNT